MLPFLSIYTLNKCLLSFQPWLDDYGKRNNLNKFAWVARASKPKSHVDAAFVYLFSHFLQRNISIVNTAGDSLWRSLPIQDDDIVLVTAQEKFLRTYVGIYH